MIMDKIAIHQSQYIPWYPYIKKISLADTFVLMDNVQYQKNGVQNRNKIRNNSGEFWLTIPVTGQMDDLISHKRIADKNWHGKHFKSLQMCYSKSPYWKNYSEELEAIYRADYDYLGQINENMLYFILKKLNINKKIVKLSDLKIEGEKSDLVKNICKAMDAKVYISGTGSKAYLDEEFFITDGIEIEYIESVPPSYRQFNGAFIPGLSILDMMFNVLPEDIIQSFGIEERSL